MIYVLEGPDGAGKSSYAAFLSDITGYPVIHFSNPKTDEDKTKMYDMYVETINNNPCAIFDRSWYSDIVYGPILRGAATITDEQRRTLDEMVLAGGGMIIHVTAPLRVLLERAYSRGEELIKPHQFLDIVDSYNKIFPPEVIRHVSG